jgi:hypothetical protein
LLGGRPSLYSVVPFLRWPLCLVLVSCGKDPVGPTAPQPPVAHEQVTIEPSREPVTHEDEDEDVDVPGVSVVIMTERPALLALERDGLGFGRVVFGHEAAHLGELAGLPGWQSLVKTIGRDLDGLAAADRHAGVGMRHLHRLFDRRWLTADATRLELVGVVNRLDRHVFHPGTCGETRLIYRLAYRAANGETTIESRLPMTANVVFFQGDDGDGCRSAAARWMAPPDLTVDQLASWATAPDGPLATQRLALEHLKAVEINLQSVRWPSTVRPDLAGHAGYLMRVFVPSSDEPHRFEPSPLENTPDVERLRRHAADREALVAWLRQPETLAALEEGTAVMPERFAAQVAQSVTPRGFARLANRPFSQLVTADDLADLELGAFTHIGSPRALLRRLDGLSCVGCHQARAVAGFHLLGEDPPEKTVDALAVATSPHLDGELLRRTQSLEQLVNGRPVDETRPLADAERAVGGYGARCGLGDPGLTQWRCRSGLACVQLDDPDFGACLPEGERGAGDPCEVGQMKPHADAARDRIVNARTLPCDRAGVCQSNRVGFPGGMCSVGCFRAGDDEVCGLIPALQGFNTCIGRRRPFEGCIVDNASPAAMRGCDNDHPCRDDYICARSSSQRGVCMPPYFLFQLRVDGHVL